MNMLQGLRQDGFRVLGLGFGVLGSLFWGVGLGGGVEVGFCRLGACGIKGSGPLGSRIFDFEGFRV